MLVAPEAVDATARQYLERWQARSLVGIFVIMMAALGVRVVALAVTGNVHAVNFVDIGSAALSILGLLLLRVGLMPVAGVLTILTLLGLETTQALVAQVNNLAFVPLIVVASGLWLVPRMVLVTGALGHVAAFAVWARGAIPVLPGPKTTLPAHDLFLAQYLLIIAISTGVGWILSRLLQALVSDNFQAWQHARLKSAFFARMSHEIRTPLNGIVGMAQVLAESPLSPQQQADLATLVQASDSLRGIVNNVLDLSKMEAGQLELDVVTYDLIGTTEAVTALYQRAAAEKGLDLAFRPEAGAPRWVEGDPLRYRQVLGNLVSNAIRFTEAGHVVVSLSRPQAGVADVRLQVVDTGVGIPAEQARHVFDDYAQGLAVGSVKFQGTGLGLAICRQLVSAMGGRIAFNSTPGAGSTFVVDLPLPERAPPAPHPVVNDDGTGRPLRVLVAEDDRVSQHVMQSLLANRGHAVTLVDNGPDAFREVTTRPYDLAFLDLQLPQMDGLAVCRAIRAQEGLDGRTRLFVVALTAHASVEWAQVAGEAGMDRYLTKPLTSAEITEVLRQAGDDRPSSWIGSDEQETPALSMAPVVTAFLEDAPDLMLCLNEAYQAGDHAGMAGAAHQLAGALGYVGAAEARALAVSLASEPGQPAAAARIRDLATLLERLYADLSDALA